VLHQSSSPHQSDNNLAQSQAIVTDGTVYVSGQIPQDSEGNLVEGSIADKTRQCLTNMQLILEEAGSSLEKVVKCNIFITDMKNFAELNGEYGKWFSAHKPARSCVAVYQLPKGVPVEIECIAKL